MESPNLETTSISELFDNYSNDVYRYAFAALGDAEEAYDVVQEVFLRAHRAFAGFRHDANPKTWVMSIARNYVVDLIRKRQRDRKHAMDRILLEVHDRTLSMDVVFEVKEALAQLKPTHREVLVLRYVDGLSARETASVLGWNEQKVRNTAKRAMMKLRKILGGE